MKDIYVHYMYSYPHKTAYGELYNIKFTDYKDALYQNPAHLYFHIPFCQTKCGYCNLFSVTGTKETFIDSYIDAMNTQSIQYDIADVPWQSLTIGGGTPLVLNRNQLERLFTCAKNTLHVDPDKTFICIETSPNQTTYEKAADLKQYGVNRVSIGIQSFNDGELKTLNRYHSSSSCIKALEILKKADFETLNIDLIYGIPGQTLTSLAESITQALAYDPEEIFIYPLYRRQMMSQSEQNPHTYEMYCFLSDHLQEKGYKQTSMRRFAKTLPHDSKSCGFENTISIGCGGRSYLGSLHYCEAYTAQQETALTGIRNYIEKADKTEISNGYVLNEDEQKRRYVIKNLFYCHGIDYHEYKVIFKGDIMDDFPVLRTFLSEYCISDGLKLSLTPKGMAYSDYLGPKFISEEVGKKMGGRHTRAVSEGNDQGVGYDT